MITLKSPREIEKMREAGQLLSKVFEVIKPHIKEGVSTYAISKVADKIVVLNKGLVVDKGDFSHIINHAKDEYTKLLIEKRCDVMRKYRQVLEGVKNAKIRKSMCQFQK